MAGEEMRQRVAVCAMVGVGVLLLGMSPAVQAECFIGGEITAEYGSYPGYPNWKYTAVISWDTGTQYALSHLDILLDEHNGSCACSDLADALVFEGLLGRSEGDPMGCEVQYEAILECSGDPSIPGVGDIILKLEPVPGDCEPGTTGTLTFVFYSVHGPAPIDEEILALFDKYGRLFCSGNLSGSFPSLACDPVSSRGVTWDAMKGLFR